ncbi:MAG: uracil-DNA glycosylase [Clostridia bacterium]|nr:uracil-DNA glycosylase [Clostridia bacterium]
MFNTKWDKVLKQETEKDYFIKLMAFVNEEYANKTIFPPKDCIFNAFKFTDYDDVKVVILGQDPYHEQGQAHGLAFSVNKGITIPPSLCNMYKELNSDLGCYIPDNGYLEKWAKQGVLLLNTVLTVEEGKANSHKKTGWTTFTDSVIKALNERKTPVIFLLWGGNAKEKLKYITNPHHYVLTTVHPSPLSAYGGFFGCKHFSKTNAILSSIGEKKIDWQIENV